MSDFHFLRPEWFLALIPAILLLWLLWRRRLRSRSWQGVCDPELLPHLLIGRSQRRANWPLWLLLAGALLIVTTLAGPTWRKQPQPLLRQQSALVILFDLSRSMHAGDLKPSRLERARLKVKDILRQRHEGQTALIAFAGAAFVVTPLTDDQHTIELLLDSLTPELMPVQGSVPAQALQLGAKLLQNAGLKQGTLLLVTDEDRPQQVETTARQLHSKGVQLAVLGVGTPEGAPIPLSDGGFFKDADGNLVLPKLNESGLRRLAEAGGGHYRRLSIDDSDFRALLTDLDSHRLDRATQANNRFGDRWQEAGIWLLWPLALLAACAFRRGWLVVLVLLLVTPPEAQALDWQALWQRPDQQAYHNFTAGEYSTAGERFKDARWKASALYRAGQYAEALKAQPKAQSADDWYNRGNTLARTGQFTEALKAYDQALKLNPADADAKTNRELVEQALQMQKQQQQQGSQDQKSKEQKAQQGDQNNSGNGQQSQDNGDQQQEGNSTPPTDQPKDDATESNQAPDTQRETEDRQPQNQASRSQQSAAQQPQTSQAQGSQKDDQSGQTTQAAASAENQPPTAEQRELQQWLQRIPDDPGGLLRRKFLYQYRQRGEQLETDRPW